MGVGEGWEREGRMLGDRHLGDAEPLEYQGADEAEEPITWRDVCRDALGIVRQIVLVVLFFAAFVGVILLLGLFPLRVHRS